MQPLSWSIFNRHTYHPLQSDEAEGAGNDKATPTEHNQIFQGRFGTALKFGILCSLMLVSFFLGRKTSSTGQQDFLGLGVVDYEFRYNRTFGEPPSDTTNAAWESIFPKHGGFFVHPELAPKRSAFSVFHQLHCLDELRHGFYVLHDQVIAYSEMQKSGGSNSNSNGNGKRAANEHSLGHIRHCIDLLRQSLMCQADLTIELKDEELGGVTGFGTSHQCTNWNALLGWVEQWENIDAPPLANVSHHDHAGTSAPVVD